VEAIRVLMVAHRSGREARTRCLNQVRHLGFCAPDELRERFRGVPVDVLARTAAGLRPNASSDPVLFATKSAMQTLGRRVLAIDADGARLHDELVGLVRATAPSLLGLPGVGVHTAALLLIAAGDNAERITSEAAFAHLCGVAPIHASSGKTVRHRLNRAGNRQANHATAATPPDERRASCGTLAVSGDRQGDGSRCWSAGRSTACCGEVVQCGRHDFNFGWVGHPAAVEVDHDGDAVGVAPKDGFRPE
jgi:transposase